MTPTSGLAPQAETMAARVEAWARGDGREWWTPGDAAAALGVSEDEMRAALGELEDMGLVYRAVASRDAYTVTADGRNVEARVTEEEVAPTGDRV